MADDPYQLLGLNEGASAADVRRAYRRLAKQYHPDVNGGSQAAETRFKTLAAARDAIIGAGARPRHPAQSRPQAPKPPAPRYQAAAPQDGAGDERGRNFDAFRSRHHGAARRPAPRKSWFARRRFNGFVLGILDGLVTMLAALDRALTGIWFAIKLLFSMD